MQTAVIQLHPQRPSRKAPMELISELQSLGLRLDDPAAGAQSRRGGAGPSDHKAVTVDGHTVMIPVHTAGAWSSPYVATQPGADGASRILRDGVEVGVVSFPHQPRFYKMQTFDEVLGGKAHMGQLTGEGDGGGDVVADRGVRAPAGLHGGDPRVGQDGVPAQEVGVLGGVDVVGQHRE